MSISIEHRVESRSRRVLSAALASIALIAAPALVHAQQFPDKPMRVIVGSPPGALGDVLARITAQKLGDALGQPTIVDNRPGAAIAIAADAVAKSVPDGHTLFLTPDSSIVVNPFIYKKLPYDPIKDFKSVALLGKVTLVLVVSPTLEVKTMKEFIQKVKANPGKINFGSGGLGHTTQLAMEVVRNRLGLDMMHVPYKGTSPAIQATVTGEVGATIVGIAESMPLVKAGRIVPLATTGPLGKESFPNLPQLTDLHKDLDITPWFGLFVPAATPPAVIAKLNAEVNKFLTQPDVKQRFVDFGLMPSPGAPDALDQVIQADMARFGTLIKQLGITAD